MPGPRIHTAELIGGRIRAATDYGLGEVPRTPRAGLHGARIVLGIAAVVVNFAAAFELETGSWAKQNVSSCSDGLRRCARNSTSSFEHAGIRHSRDNARSPIDDWQGTRRSNGDQ